MADWYDSATPITLGNGPAGAEPATIVADVGTGNVQIQFKDQTGAWFTPADAEYTIATSDNVVRIERSNSPAVRILATGNAVFQVWGPAPESFEAIG